MQDNKIDVEKIIERINNREKNEAEPSQVGLVFEVGSPDEQEEPKSETPKVNDGEEETSSKEEFSVPDVFSVSEEYNTPTSEDYTNHIHMTYVPRFTDASEKYRMKGDATTEEPKTETATVRCDDDDVDISGIDPTAETTETVVEGAVVVDMTKPSADDNSDMLNVYKFADEGEKEEQTPRERTVDDEREEIESLLETPAVSEAEVETDRQEPEAPLKKSAEDYELPDPDIEIKKEEKPTDEDAPAPQPQSAKTRLLLGEYTLPQQRDTFVQRFLDTLISQKIRLFSSLIFSLLLLCFEVCVAMNVFADRIFGIPVTSMAVGIIDLLLAGCTLALALPEAVYSIKKLVSGRLVPSLATIVTYAYLALYYSIVFAIGGVTDYPLFGFIYSIFACTAIISSGFKNGTDFEAFKLVSKSDDLQVIKQNLTREVPKENIVLDGLVDEYKARTARAVSTSFANGFIKAGAKTINQNKHLVILFAVSFGASLISSAVAFFAFGGLLSAVSTFTIVNLLGIPTFMLASHSVSYHDSQKTLSQLDSCACGELSYHDFANSDVVVFDDVDIFGPDDVKLTRYLFLGEGDTIDGTMRQMCSLFSVVGGPLGALFANALDSRITTKMASEAEIELDGLSGNVGTHKVSAGTGEYMIRHGVEIPGGVPDTRLDTTKIIYAAEDGKLSAKFYIRYSFSEEFTMVLPLLKKEGIIPLIYTRDPNVNNELLQLLTAGADSMRVMKVTTPISASEVEKSKGESATFVTANDKMDVASIVLHAKKHKRFLERIHSTELYATIVGAVLATLISFFGMLSVPALVFSAWPICWCIVMRLASGRALAPERQRKNKRAE